MTQALLTFAGALIPGLLLAAAITIHGRVQRRRQDAAWAREQAERAAARADYNAEWDKVMDLCQTQGVEAAWQHIQHDPHWKTPPASNKT